MKTVAFHIDNLSFRGTTTAVRDYARYNQELLNNKSIIILDQNIKNSLQDENFLRKQEVLEYYKDNFSVVEYSNKTDFEHQLQKNNCDFVYFLKAGFNDGFFSSTTKSLIHCVFNHYQPHGHKYAYVSRWLAEVSSNNKCKYVPHIVDLPKQPKIDFREKHGIEKDKLVIGRYGGFDQFDIDFVKGTIGFILANDPDIVFVFVNTRNFLDSQHPRIKFLDSIIDPQEKTDFISSCDAMLHARSDGESFGLSICEFLFHNKPTISFGGGRDKNNVEILKNYGLIYNNQYQLLENIFKLKHKKYNNCYECIVKEYSPKSVMKKFNEVFLGD